MPGILKATWEYGNNWFLGPCLIKFSFFSFCFIVLVFFFFEIGFLCIALAVLELTLETQGGRELRNPPASAHREVGLSFLIGGIVLPLNGR